MRGVEPNTPTIDLVNPHRPIDALPKVAVANGNPFPEPFPGPIVNPPLVETMAYSV